MKRLFFGMAIFWCAAAWSAPIGMPEGKWWKNTRVVRELGLTGSQGDQIEKVFLRVRPTLIDLRADLEKKRLLQESVMEQPNVDTREAARRIDDVEQARSKLAKTRATMFLEIRQILTPEQRKKARDFQDRLRDRRQQRFRGPRDPE